MARLSSNLDWILQTKTTVNCNVCRSCWNSSARNLSNLASLLLLTVVIILFANYLLIIITVYIFVLNWHVIHLYSAWYFLHIIQSFKNEAGKLTNPCKEKPKPGKVVFLLNYYQTKRWIFKFS